MASYPRNGSSAYGRILVGKGEAISQEGLPGPNGWDGQPGASDECHQGRDIYLSGITNMKLGTFVAQVGKMGEHTV
jgi:hypothetical protein